MRIALVAALLVGAMPENAVFRMVEELAARRPFTPEGVARITGTKLRRDPASNQYFTFYRSAKDARAPIREVELRVPTPEASARDGLVVLSLNAPPCITPADVMARFGKAPEVGVPEPAAPYESSYKYRRPWGELRFAFARGSRCLTDAVLDATQPPPAR